MDNVTEIGHQQSLQNKLLKITFDAYVAKAIYALFAYASQKRFTRFVRKVFARKGLPTGNFGLFRPLT